MRQFALEDFVRGWFVGDFEPSIVKTGDVEVAVQKFPAGTYEAAHYHKKATEITVLINGRAEMFNQVIEEGSVVKIDPGEVTSFKAITDCTTVVVKYPGVKDDKYGVE